MSNLWELEMLEECLHGGDIRLANRYLEKALERVRCMYCHGSLEDSRSYRPHFKGFVHDECAELYSGRIDYLNKNGEGHD